MNKLKLFAILFVTTISLCRAQKQGYNWYFGQQCALNFSTGSPVWVNGSQSGLAGVQEGTSTISDSAGNLLMYSGSICVWNRNNQIMPHGDSLLGGVSTTQSSIIIPLPGSDSLFYLFTLDQFQDWLRYGLRYDVIDMCMDNGLGDVLPCEKNIPLLDTASEKLCAMRDSLGNYWILVHKFFSDAFYAFYLSPGGITDSVITHIGTFHGGIMYNINNFPSAIGQMKFSPNGRKVALAIGNQTPNLVDMFDFNPATGIVSNWITDTIAYNTGCGYGVEFSPDNSKLYVNDLGGLLTLQYNMNAGNDNAILASRDTVSATTPVAGMQLATDGKIYISDGGDYLDVINYPDSIVAKCGFVIGAIHLPNNDFYSFPGFVANFNYGNTVPPCSAYSLNKIVTNPNCAAANGSVSLNPSGLMGKYSITWNTNPVQTGDSATNLVTGVYVATITDTVITSCGPLSQTITDTTVLISKLGTGSAITVNSPTLCSGKSVTLTATGAIIYTWSPGIGLNATTGDTVIADPTITTTYIIIGTNNGCVDTTQSIVSVVSTPVVNIEPPSPSVCIGQSILLTISGDATYTWSATFGLSATIGDTVIASPTVTITYTVIGNNSGCADTATTVVTVNPNPVVNAPAPPAICNGSMATLTASGANTYTWFPSIGLSNSTGDTITANPTVTTTYTVACINGNGCTDITTVTVNVSPILVLGVDTPLPKCSGSSDTLIATGANSYTWSPSLGLSATSGAAVMANPTVTTTYTITGTSLSGCTGATMVMVAINPNPSLIVKTPSPICNGEHISLTLSGGTSYTWTPSTGLSATTGDSVIATPSITTTYSISATLGSCLATDSIIVTVNPLPDIDITPSQSVCLGDSICL